MNEKHRKKIEKLAETFKQSLIAESKRLYISGGINVDEYDENLYSLAKIIITVAADNLKNSFSPPAGSYLQEEIDNLKHF